MPSPTTILLVDDNDGFRTAMRMLLKIEPTFLVVGEAADGPTGVRLSVELRPDIVLMDVEMPGEINGIDATRRVRASWNGHAGIVVGLSSSPAHEPEMLDAGAAAFVPKEQAVEIVSRIKAIVGH